MTIKNFTPHSVIVFHNDEDTVFESAGCARLHASSVQIAKTPEGVPITKTIYGMVEGLPEPQPGTYYIVSSLVKQALPERDDLLHPAELVRNERGAVIGCRSLSA